MKSRARRVAKTANVVATGTKPALASPTATLIRFSSAMPTFTKRSGNAWANGARPVTPATSAESVTTSGRRSPISRIARPNGPDFSSSTGSTEARAAVPLIRTPPARAPRPPTRRRPRARSGCARAARSAARRARAWCGRSRPSAAPRPRARPSNAASSAGDVVAVALVAPTSRTRATSSTSGSISSTMSPSAWVRVHVDRRRRGRSRRSEAANIADSHVEPSCSSPSVMKLKMRAGHPLIR